jgi:hypothetical protein
MGYLAVIRANQLFTAIFSALLILSSLAVLILCLGMFNDFVMAKKIMLESSNESHALRLLFTVIMLLVLIMMGVSLLGIYGIVTRKRTYVFLFAVAMIVMVVLNIFVMVYGNRWKRQDKLKKYLTNNFNKVFPPVLEKNKVFFDTHFFGLKAIQEHFQCCGPNGIDDYRDIRRNNVPELPTIYFCPENTTIGCANQLTNSWNGSIDTMIVFFSIIVSIQILVSITSCVSAVLAPPK